jgi:hypothetical protein
VLHLVEFFSLLLIVHVLQLTDPQLLYLSLLLSTFSYPEIEMVTIKKNKNFEKQNFSHIHIDQLLQSIERFYQIHMDEFDRVDRVQYQPIVANDKKTKFN